MRFAKFLRLLLIPAVLFAVLSPVVASASGGPADSAAISLDDGLATIDQDGEDNTKVGMGVALFIIAFVLMLVAIVAVIAAASLGIIGLSYWQSMAE